MKTTSPRLLRFWQLSFHTTRIASAATFENASAIAANVRRNNLLRWVNITGTFATVVTILAYLL